MSRHSDFRQKQLVAIALRRAVFSFAGNILRLVWRFVNPMHGEDGVSLNSRI